MRFARGKLVAEALGGRCYTDGDAQPLRVAVVAVGVAEGDGWWCKLGGACEGFARQHPRTTILHLHHCGRHVISTRVISPSSSYAPPRRRRCEWQVTAEEARKYRRATIISPRRHSDGVSAEDAGEVCETPQAAADGLLIARELVVVVWGVGGG